MTSSKLAPNSLPVAALMLCHRYDARLGRALESVNWAQQVLVLDTNPKSGIPWAMFAQKYPQFNVLAATSFETNFSAWRNQLLAHVKQPWVFFIDSDEVAIVSKPTEFSTLMKTTPNSYSLQRIDYFHTKPLRYGETGQLWLNRLGPRQNMHFQRVVHEVTSQKAQPITSLVLHHESHLSISDFIEKLTLYAALEGKSRSLKPPINIYLQAVCFPIAKFIHNFFFKLGFLDGWRGLVYATMMSLHSFMVRVFWYEKKHSRTT